MSLTYTNQRKYKAVTVVCMLGDIYVEPLISSSAFNKQLYFRSALNSDFAENFLILPNDYKFK